jgi:hypothetical protein
MYLFFFVFLLWQVYDTSYKSTIQTLIESVYSEDVSEDVYSDEEEVPLENKLKDKGFCHWLNKLTLGC